MTWHSRPEGTRTVADIASALCHAWHHLIEIDLLKFKAEHHLTIDEFVRDYVVIFEGDSALYTWDWSGNAATVKPNRNWRIVRRDELEGKS